ncbi:MAG TPA: lasso peptide biosynthesis protein, partial [Thermodesulfobacteriota bacterium]|nr:lasso peptide biosynthesis protein [Thermodesulfobacteriota bacterium]
MVLNGNFVRKIRANFNSFENVELFIQIFILLTVLPLLIKLLSLPRLMKLLTPNDVKVLNNQDSKSIKEKVVKYTGYILSRNFWIYKAICWKRALVLYHFLRKAGVNVQICFGVRLPNIEAKDELEG